MSGISMRLTLVIRICGDQVRDLPCVQQASYLEGSPLMWMMLLCLHINLNADDDDNYRMSEAKTFVFATTTMGEGGQ